MTIHGIPVIDAWIQPWLAGSVAAMPARNMHLADRVGEGSRLRAEISPELMLAEMDAAGVDRALCSAGPLIANADVIAARKVAPDRLIAVASVDPFGPDGVMVAVRELERLVVYEGFRGLKLEPFIQDKPLTEPQWYPLYAECCRLGITMQVQVGATGPPTYPSYTGMPHYVDRVAIDFPDLRIVAGHIGVPWTDEMIMVAAKHPNVWIDTSVHMPRRYPPSFVHFLRTYGQDKCLWGSDWPIQDFTRALDGLDALALPEPILRKLLHDNAVAAFALDPA